MSWLSLGSLVLLGSASLTGELHALPSNLDGDPPFGTSKHYAWSQNASWINGSPFGYTDEGVQVTSLTVSGKAWSQNTGWVNFGDGTPNNGLRYSNTSAADCGVNMDWRGNLSGYAWTQNAGWINFGWAGANDANRPRFNATTFRFDGFAWSQNLGWLNLNGDWLRTDGLIGYPDGDGDGIPDAYELANNTSLSVWNNSTDTDNDGLADGWEFTHLRSLTESNGTQDSDGDGWSDAVEFAANTNPGNSNNPTPWPTPPNGSTIDENANFAWAQNLGWMNARHDQPSAPAGVVVTAYHLRGTAWLQNAGWVMFGDGTPRDGLRYSNTSADDCGVNIDCDFNLSGYAWTQNLGWINFGWASSSDPGRARLQNTVGSKLWQGYAWSQNAGWINLELLNNTSMPLLSDVDGDGLPDQWEFQRVIDLAILDANADTDGDGLGDAWEFANFRALNITNGSGDFDQDGSTDAEEFLASTNPRDAFSLPPPTGSSIAGTGKFVWSQSAGWVNFKHDRPQAPSGVIVREYFLSGRAWGQNVGWVDLGDGTPADGIRYGNATSNDCGVNHDGAGNLSGFAWSQNAGWINFGWAASSHADRARVLLGSGAFAGYAWSQNIGWINLGTGLQTLSIDLTDTDGDGIDDAWEREQFGNLVTATSLTDTDHDGQSDLAEFLSGSVPTDATSLLRIVAHSIDATRTQETLTFTSRPSRIYQVSDSADLLTFSPMAPGWFSVAPSTTGTTSTTAILPAPSDHHFFRVSAKRALTP